MFKRNNRYFALGVTLLMVIVISVLFYTVITHLSTVYSAIKYVLNILSSVFFGIAFAYLMNPIMKRVEALVQKLLAKSNITERGLRKLSRGIGVVSALIVFLLVIYGLIAMVAPQLVTSLTETFSQRNLDAYYHQFNTWLDNIFRDTPFEQLFREHDLLQYAQSWIRDQVDLFATLNNALTSAVGVGKSIFNALIGIVIAVYLLISKEKFLAQSKKLLIAIFPQQRANRLLEIGRLTNKSFGGFVVGKIIDSLIIGALSYILMQIFRLPNPLVCSVFVGVTNIIPFFGPLIGIAIGTVLTLLESPLQALFFLIVEFALQQIDGNIIGPKILGGRLGISDFWILVSITVFTGLFGFPGMILGVPVFTVIYTLVRDGVNKSLSKKNLPIKTELYYTLQTVEDLEQHQKEFGEATVFYSGDTFDTEYDPDEDIEYDENPDEM